MTNNEIVEWLKYANNVTPYLPTEIQLHNLLFIGGQGVVYRGLVDSVDAAIKIYFPGQVDKRIEREIRALREIQCPTIVDLLWSDKLNIAGHELNVVATSFVEGTPLDKVIGQKTPITDTQLDIIAYDVALAIQAMWSPSRRIVHRDLKPSNILLRPNKRACVIDLGVARHLNDSSLTQAGWTWGTRGYLSPEQARGVRQLTSKSDIFALGVVLLETAMGRHPTHNDQARLEISDFHKVLPRELANWANASLLKGMLEPNPVKRPRPSEILRLLSMYSDQNHGV